MPGFVCLIYRYLLAFIIIIIIIIISIIIASFVIGQCAVKLAL
jgi:hypothetical protein